MSEPNLGPETNAPPKPSSDSSTRQTILVLVSVVAIALALYGIGQSGSGPLDLQPPFLQPSPVGSVDPDWTLRDLDGEAVSFGQFQGRPVLLNVWATWCPPCRRELPTFQALANREDLPEEVAIVLVMPEPADPKTIRATMGQLAVNQTCYTADTLPAILETGAFPSTFLITEDGRVAAYAVGEADWAHDSVVQALAELTTLETAIDAQEPDPASSSS